MWSGPRNLSTAMMRAWENRPDTDVWDEPFYAYYLAQTQRPDPLADETMQSGIVERDMVVERLITPPAAVRYHYHKHITTHILPEDSVDWLDASPGMRHVFLIREPARVVASFTERFSADDSEALVDFLGFEQQLRIFKAVQQRFGKTPPVIDSTRFLHNPRQHLETLCRQLDIPFTDAMLSWPEGARASDGVWAAHWYRSVRKSTGFGPPPDTVPVLTARQKAVAARCQPAYDALLRHAM